MAKVRFKKPRADGRNETEHFFRVTRGVYLSPAYQDLGNVAFRLYMEIRRRYNGYNNGEISLSCREAADVAHCGKDTARRALIELVEHGLVKLVRIGRFTYGDASEWALTDEKIGDNPPTRDWRNWQPKTKDSPCHAAVSTYDSTVMGNIDD